MAYVLLAHSSLLPEKTFCIQEAILKPTVKFDSYIKLFVSDLFPFSGLKMRVYTHIHT